MHRTESIDYGIVLAGEVTLVLDDGSETSLRRRRRRRPARHRSRLGEPDGRAGADGLRPRRRPLHDELRALLPAGELFDQRARRVSERFVVTGAHGCLGAWAVAELVREGREVMALDVAPGRGRAELLLDDEELARVGFVQADITESHVPLHGATHVVHLAALQYPYCRDDHAAGARVNVLGTVNVFDAALAAGAKLVYASSIAALAEGPLRHVEARERGNRGGVLGRGWLSEHRDPRRRSSTASGRDRGVTASMTLAMEAAARGEPFPSSTAAHRR